MADTEQWPPRSPHAALLSTPGGRRRLQGLTDRTSPLPSPSRSRRPKPDTTLSARTADRSDLDSQDGGEDDDDEETLQLKLQAIQAKLKLKKLQNAKGQKTSRVAPPHRDPYTRPQSAPGVAPGGIPLQARLQATREQRERPRSQVAVQVPASPVKRSTSAAALPPSPARVALGIDKGRAANEVSLKRAPSVKTARDQDDRRQGGYLQRNRAPLAVLEQRPERPASFSERLLGARSEEGARLQKLERVHVARSTGFSISHKEMENYKNQAVDIASLPQAAQAFSREQVVASSSRSKKEGVTGGQTAPDIASFDDNTPSFEPYSSFHLSKRIIPHQTLARVVNGKVTYVLAELLKHVKAPDWSLPDIEQDIVVFAIVASKSDPRKHKPKPGADSSAEQGKYMVLTMVDLQWEIELYLFNTGFDRFWKLVPGTLVAILNPTIMPPPAGRAATGRFGLVINSDADTILEIGSARDLGFCQSLKRDGQLCSTWVNARRTQYCEFHTNEAVRRAGEKRSELNSMDFGSSGRRRWNSHHNEDPDQAAARKKKDRNPKKGTYHSESGSHLFVNGAHRGISLLDDERENGTADAAERRSALRRRLAAREKEDEIAQKLSQLGASAGRDYMRTGRRLADSSMPSSSTGAEMAAGSENGGGIDGVPPRKVDARSLGLIVPRGQETKISLSPIKRKRPISALSTSFSTYGSSSVGDKSGSALGWGTSLRDKLTRMKEGEHLEVAKPSEGKEPFRGGRDAARTERSPVRKKTRFVTEKGIREAGRDSLGAPLSAAQKRSAVALDDDDDDDLLIVK